MSMDTMLMPVRMQSTVKMLKKKRHVTMMTMMVVTKMITILAMVVVSEVIKVLTGLLQPMLAVAFAFASSLNVLER